MTGDRRDEDAFRWLEAELGGTIVSRVRDDRWRPQWFLEVEVAGEVKPVVLRGFRNPGYTAPDEAGSRAALASEATVLAALEAVPVRSPAFYGHDAELGWLAMERLPGESESTQITDDARRYTVYQEYMAALAQLHAFPVGELDLDQLPHPATSMQFKNDILARHEAVFRSFGLRLPEPTMELGYQWMHDNELPSERPVCLGLVDAGPNQFMFEGSRFAGLIDVEFGMVVDPLMEIGMMRSRELTYPVGRMPEHLRHYGRCYEALTGIALDHDALRYWSIAGPTLFNTFTLPANQRPDPMMVDAPFACAWEVHQKRGLLEAVAEYYGFDLRPPELSSSGPSMMSPLFELLAEQLAGYYDARATGAEDRAFTRYSAALARTLSRCHEHALTLDRDNLEDLSQLLGRRPHGFNDAMAQLQQAIAEDYTEDLERRVQVLHRIEVRRDHLLRPLQQATGVGGGEPMARLAEMAGA